MAGMSGLPSSWPFETYGVYATIPEMLFTLWMIRYGRGLHATVITVRIAMDAAHFLPQISGIVAGNVH